MFPQILSSILTPMLQILDMKTPFYEITIGELFFGFVICGLLISFIKRVAGPVEIQNIRSSYKNRGGKNDG